MENQSLNPSALHSFSVSPSEYDSTPNEVITQANHLGMTPEIIKPSWLQKLFVKSVHQSIGNSIKVRIHPHGLTPSDRLHSLMLFFHFLGHSKRNRVL